MKKSLISFVLDETGSMLLIKDATISGFNEWLETVKFNGKSARVTLTCFNSNRLDIKYNDVPAKDVKKLTSQSYNPDAMTPLYDAIGTTIKSIEESIAKSNDNPDVLMVILTDGQENHSKEYTSGKIFDLIEEKKKEGWAFIYLGANQDSWDQGVKIAVDGISTMDFAATSKGVSRGMSASANYTASYLASDDRQVFCASTSLSDFDPDNLIIPKDTIINKIPNIRKVSKKKEVKKNG